MDSGMAQGMLALTLVVIGSLGGESVADEFGVEVEGVVRLFEGETEVVHREDIFEELGLLEVANATGLSSRVESVREGVGTGVKVVVIA